MDFNTSPLHISAFHGVAMNRQSLEWIFDIDPKTPRSAFEPEAISRGFAAFDEMRKTGETMAMWAASSGKADVLSMLLAGAVGKTRANECDHSGLTPLMWISHSMSHECACLLLNAGADANRQDSKGRTALMRFASRGERRLAALLLDHGADPSIPDAQGKTAGRWAREFGYDDLADFIDAPRG